MERSVDLGWIKLFVVVFVYAGQVLQILQLKRNLVFVFHKIQHLNEHVFLLLFQPKEITNMV